MQIYMDRLSDGKVQWEIFVNPTIALDSRGVTFNGKFYSYLDIVRLSIDGKSKTFTEAFLWAKKDTVFPDKSKWHLYSKTMSVPVMTFIVENIAKKCVEPLSRELEEIPEVDLKKQARAVMIRQAREQRKKS